MKCADVQKILEQYMDLLPEDQRRLQVDQHITECKDCADELEFWKESLAWIEEEEAVRNTPMPTPAPAMSDSVMSKIYSDESWRVPVTDRIYAIPYKARRNLTAFIAMCLAVFVFSFLYSLVVRESHDPFAVENSKFGFHQAVSASDNYNGASIHAELMNSKAFAGHVLIEPLKLGPIQSFPDYFVVLSFLGITAALLILNWWSRTKA